jgi:hypothetical protein
MLVAISSFVGALVAMLLGHAVSNRYTHEREIRKLRIERLEQIVQSLYDQSMWHQIRLKNVLSKDSDKQLAQPFTTAKMLVSLYYPNLEYTIVRLHELQIPIIEASNEYLDNKIDAEKFDGWFKNYKANQKIFRDELTAFAPVYREELEKQLEIEKPWWDKIRKK